MRSTGSGNESTTFSLHESEVTAEISLTPNTIGGLMLTCFLLKFLGNQKLEKAMKAGGLSLFLFYSC
jgi:hypothetical protein